MKQSKLNFTIVLWLFGLIPMLIVSVGFGTKAMTTINSELEEAAYKKLYLTASDMAAYYNAALLATGEIAYNTSYIDSHLEDDIELTLFLDDVRFITSVKDSTGKRNEGTTADPTIYSIVKSGKTFSDHNVQIGGNPYYVYYVPLYGKDNEIIGMSFAGTPEAEINDIVLKTMLGQTNIFIGCLVVSIILILVFAKKIKTSMTATAETLEILSSGDINIKVNVHSVIKEIQQMISATDNLQQKLASSIGLVKSTASNLDESVMTVDDLSAASARGAEQIKEAVNGLSVTAQTMAATLLTCNENLIDMGENISRITEKVRGVSDDADTMLKINDATLDFMNQVQESTNKAVSAIENIEHQTKDTNEAVERIKSAAQIIADIADQTNLLSLNASIEAARAGEAGKGFAVVADNIKQLAEQSAESANSIQDVVNEIVSLSSGSVALADETVLIIKEQEGVINESLGKINDLNDAVHIIVENVDAIDTEIDSLDKGKESILENIGDLSAIAQENAASSEEVTANVESIADGIEGTKDQSGEMKSMADELMLQIKYFH